MSIENIKRLEYATGFNELGMPIEAIAELDAISADAQHAPAVLIERAQAYLTHGFFLKCAHPHSEVASAFLEAAQAQAERVRQYLL